MSKNEIRFIKSYLYFKKNVFLVFINKKGRVEYINI